MLEKTHQGDNSNGNINAMLGQRLNPSMMLDTMMSTMMATYMMKIMDTKELSLETVIWVILLMSMSEVKEVVKESISGIRSFLKWETVVLLYTRIVSIMTYLYDWTKTVSKSKVDIDTQKIPEIDDKTVNIDISLLNSQVQDIVSFYRDEGNELVTPNRFTEWYEEPKFHTKDIDINKIEYTIPDKFKLKLASNVTLRYQSDDGKLKMLSNITIDNTHININIDDVKSIDRMMVKSLLLLGKGIICKKVKDFTIASGVKKICDGSLKYFTTEYPEEKEYANAIKELKINTMEYVVACHLHKIFPNIPFKLLLWELSISLALDYHIDPSRSTYFKRYYDLMTKQNIICINCINLKVKIPDVNMSDIVDDEALNIIRSLHSACNIASSSNHDGTFLFFYGKNTTVDSVSKTNVHIDNKHLRFMLTPLADQDFIELDRQFHEHLIEIREKYRGTESENRSIYLLKMNTEVIEETLPNPEYEQFNEKMSIMNNMNDNKESDKEEKKGNGMNRAMMYQFMNMQVPPKTITKTTSKDIIEKKLIGRINKKIDNLFLREYDQGRFRTVLTAFRDDNEFYENLGLRKKLGLLLSGPPGTGKSSAINAAANFLKKDIFYVDMSSIRRNCELKAIFDYVQREASNGGVIVLDEIDATVPEVHSRSDAEDTESLALSDIMEREKDKLDLGFILGLFDGDACTDGTVFAMTTNHPEKLDPALFRSLRVDLHIKCKLCDRYQVNNIFKRAKGYYLSDEILECIEEDKYSPADIIASLTHDLYSEKSDIELMEKFFIR